MTQQQTNYFKNNFFSFTTLVVVVGFVINQSKWQEKVDNHIETFETHASSESMHMPFDEKIKVFVPRLEIDGRLKNIESYLNKIESKLDKINK